MPNATEKRSVKEVMKFKLDFLCLMVMAGRGEEASQTANQLSKMIDDLPADLLLEAEEETTNA